MGFKAQAQKFGRAGMKLKAEEDKKCPCCGEPCDEYSDIDFADDGIFLDYCCYECGSKWFTFYRLDYKHIFYDGTD